MQLAGIILCGGNSSRMGTPKALLPFGPELLLQRVVRLLSTVADPVVVVAAPHQRLPKLASDIRIAYDRRQARGPLEGLHAAFAALAGEAELAYVSGCDAPLLSLAFVTRLATSIARHDAAVPTVDGRHHPLSAVYRTTVMPHIESMLANDQLRLTDLLDRIDTRYVTAEELRAVDPQLDSLRNLNHPADYMAALSDAGLSVEQ